MTERAKLIEATLRQVRDELESGAWREDRLESIDRVLALPVAPDQGPGIHVLREPGPASP